MWNEQKLEIIELNKSQVIAYGVINIGGVISDCVDRYKRDGDRRNRKEKWWRLRGKVTEDDVATNMVVGSVTWWGLK